MRLFAVSVATSMPKLMVLVNNVLYEVSLELLTSIVGIHLRFFMEERPPKGAMTYDRESSTFRQALFISFLAPFSSPILLDQSPQMLLASLHPRYHGLQRPILLTDNCHGPHSP
jgi:hypothetical protein